MKRHLLSFIALFLVFVTFNTTISSAHHYRWMIMDPAKHAGSAGFNNIFLSIFNNGYTEYGYTPGVSIAPQIVAAFNAWTSKIPQTNFRDISSTDDIKVVQISSTSTSCQLSAAACLDVTLRALDSDRNAHFNVTGTIFIRDTYAGSDALEILLHEIGHALGFHEGYVDSTGACNNALTSVMDAWRCDKLSEPSTTDVNDYNNVMGGLIGTATDISHTWVGNQLNLSFKDNAIGEYNYWVHYYKVGDTTLLKAANVTKDIGLVKGITTSTSHVAKDRIITENLLFSKAGRPSGQYKAVIKTYYRNNFSRNGPEVTYYFNI
ncbi:hypothetical protein [Cohnella phaseoli]|uniref:Uncharacterized protein n=1 Tax=Cohnella phaseoli TaxID=456490 RepID=A0A3D9KDX9_9BACL|nr:hypothetical protein [Cohnella phaseoli]RED84007.1 hypothetical protein DFP98_107115 [Cohnella phaseoli]